MRNNISHYNEDIWGSCYSGIDILKGGNNMAAWQGTVEGNPDYSYYSNPNLTRHDIEELMEQQHEYNSEIERGRQKGELIAAVITGAITIGCAIATHIDNKKQNELLEKQIESNRNLALQVSGLSNSIGEMTPPVQVTQF